jgi:DNA polymerase III subunit gamma/tau
LEAVSALTTSWLDADGGRGLAIIHDSLASGADARQFARQMVDYLRQLLLLQAAGKAITLDVPAERAALMAEQAHRASRDGLVQAVRRFSEAALTTSSSWQPQLPLELAFIELLPEEAAPPATAPARTASPGKAAVAPQPEPSAPAEHAPAGQQPATQQPAESAREAPVPAGDTEAETAVVDEPAQALILTLQAVQSRWAAMVERAGQQDKNLPPLLAMCKPLAVEGDTLVLGFDFPVLKEKFESKPEARAVVGKTLGALLETRCKVRCVVTKQYTPPPPPPSLHDEFYALADELGGQVQEID